MTTTTPILGLTLYDNSTDQAVTFANYRAQISGPASSSNFYKIDTAVGALQTDIAALQNTRGAILISAGYISANYYEATSPDVTAYTTGMSIILSVDTTSNGTVTLQINALGIKSLMKVNSSGTAINLTGSDLVKGRFYLFTYDGTRWIWASANTADQIQIVGTAGNIVTVGSDNSLLGTTTPSALYNSFVARYNLNVLYNGGFRVAQRGTSFTSTGSFPNNDDSYLIDGCILLSDGNDIVDVSQVADTDFVSGYKIRLDVETGNKRFGILLPVENKDIQTIRKSGVASFQFKVKCTGTSMSNVRAYLISWNGTADAITSDVVSAWNAAGSNPTFATNWTAENAASNLSINTTIATKKIENISVDTSGVSNLAIFIMVDDTDATIGDFLEIGDVKLEEGSVSTNYVNPLIADEIRNCKRYARKSYNMDVAPGTASNPYGLSRNIVISPTANGVTYGNTIIFSEPMRTFPAVTIFGYAGGSGKVSVGGADQASNSGIATDVGDNGFTVYNNSGGNITGSEVTFHFFATAEL